MSRFSRRDLFAWLLLPLIFVVPAQAQNFQTAAAPKVTVLAYDNTQTSHTGDTNLFTLKTITIPANSMGANGILRTTIQWGFTGTAGTKTTGLTFGGTSFYSIAQGATSLSLRNQVQIANRNATNSQVGHGSAILSFNSGTTSFVTSAIDTTANVTVLLTGQLANSGDSVAVESYLVELIVP